MDCTLGAPMTTDPAHDRVFCANCERAIFRRSTDDEWAHVSTHDHACPPSVAEPIQEHR